ncbi:hypothetical protein N9U62_03675 [Candidatus Pelagibacter sp.]|nr:hypothetical protein [Candidatus Pelagibacter sp.]|tara:strand:+ start:303 stop:503 length:201 start_codon:yes stop_codon:yes gene_type:complete
MKKYKSIIFILVALVLLYLAKDKYSSFNISKSIQACLMGQKKLNPDLTKEEAEKICVNYVKEQVGK